MIGMKYRLENLDSRVGKRLEELRKEYLSYRKEETVLLPDKENPSKKYTISGVAHSLEWNRDRLSKIEKGTVSPTLDEILTLCNFYNCDIGYILGLRENIYDSKIYTKKEHVACVENKIPPALAVLIDRMYEICESEKIDSLLLDLFMDFFFEKYENPHNGKSHIKLSTIAIMLEKLCKHDYGHPSTPYTLQFNSPYKEHKRFEYLHAETVYRADLYFFYSTLVELVKNKRSERKLYLYDEASDSDEET